MLFNPTLPANMNRSVETTPSNGTAFTSSYPDWREGTYENFKEWSMKRLGVKEPDSDDDAEVPVQMQKAKNIEFETNDLGDFVLPPLRDIRTVRGKQRVVRGYIGALYSKHLHRFQGFFSKLFILTGQFTDNKTAAFPYTLDSKPKQTIFDKASVPKGFVLSDPDHLTGSQVLSLYNHWLGRQERKLPGFVI